MLSTALAALDKIEPLREKQFYTKDEVCEILNYSKSQLSRDCADGKFIRVGRNKYDKSSVDEYFENYVKEGR